jgi:hypothetical protein
MRATIRASLRSYLDPRRAIADAKGKHHSSFRGVVLLFALFVLARVVADMTSGPIITKAVVLFAPHSAAF